MLCVNGITFNMGLAHSPSIISDGLVFYLDAANRRSYSGSGITVNSLTGGIGGTLYNGVGFGSTNSGYFTFDGTNDYLDIPSITSISGDFSVLIWFKSNSSNVNYARLMDFDFANGFWLGRSTSVNTWGGGIKEGVPPFGIFLTLPDNEWHFLASIRNSTTHILYGDGITNTNSNTVTNTSLSSSKITLGTSVFNDIYNGIIAQVQIYNRALTQQEILQNYNATRKRFGL
jgi:hypothetical protein